MWVRKSFLYILLVLCSGVTFCQSNNLEKLSISVLNKEVVKNGIILDSTIKFRHFTSGDSSTYSIDSIQFGYNGFYFTVVNYARNQKIEVFIERKEKFSKYFFILLYFDNYSSIRRIERSKQNSITNFEFNNLTLFIENDSFSKIQIVNIHRNVLTVTNGFDTGYLLIFKFRGSDSEFVFDLPGTCLNFKWQREYFEQLKKSNHVVIDRSVMYKLDSLNCLLYQDTGIVQTSNPRSREFLRNLKRLALGHVYFLRTDSLNGVRAIRKPYHWYKAK